MSGLAEASGAAALIGAVRRLAFKLVPRNASWLYTMGSLAIFFFAIQFFTGCLLLAHYVPDEKLAYASIQTIEHRASLGWLIRQMHSWGASFIVLALILHVLKVLWYGSYKKPRAFTWFAGCLLLATTLGFCFSGYLLPWNQLAFWATRVATDAMDAVPLLGAQLKALFCGGSEVSGETLGRFFTLHVVVLPALLVLLLAYHLALVVWKGSAPRTSVAEELDFGQEAALEQSGAEPFFPRQVYRDLLACNFGFALLVTAATFWPWELGEPASPVTPPGIKPEWYFLPMYQFLKYFDETIYSALPFLGALHLAPDLLGVLCLNLVAAVLFFLPLLDRGGERRLRRRPFFALFALLCLGGIFVLGLLGYVAEREVTLPFLGRYHFTTKGFPVPVASALEGQTSPSPESGAPAPGAPQGGEAVPGGDAGSLAVPAVDDGLPRGGACGSCHESQRDEWLGSVHHRARVQCIQCHGGKDTEPPERLLAPLEELVTGEGGEWPDGIESVEEKRRYLHAHDGMIVSRRGRPGVPSRSVVPAFCGAECHQTVYQHFSPRHLEESPARSCIHCHSNHAVLAAGYALYEEKGYTEADDARAAPFQEVKRLLQSLEAQLAALYAPLARLEERAYPAAEMRGELEALERRAKGLHALSHAIDPQLIEEGTMEQPGRKKIAAGAGRLAAEIEGELEAPDDRWLFAAGVWVVALLLGALLFRGLRRCPVPAAGPSAAALSALELERELEESGDERSLLLRPFETPGEERPDEDRTEARD
jgi:ubiquinol-cytochrome c reductase cytochrome b subunit